jgi:hypothetical protein
VLQIMPVFFLLGGYANLVGWQRAQATGTTAGQFVGVRLRRLLWPTAVWALIWLAGELIAAALPGPHRWIWDWFPGYLTPLWFLGVYGLLIAAVPITATLHARHGAWVLVALVLLIAVGSVAHRGAGLAWEGWVTAALVWVFCHQSATHHQRGVAQMPDSHPYAGATDARPVQFSGPVRNVHSLFGVCLASRMTSVSASTTRKTATPPRTSHRHSSNGIASVWNNPWTGGV